MKKIIYILFIFVLAISACTKPGIAPDQANSFVKFYGSKNYSEGFDVKQVSDGSIYALGYANDADGANKLYLVKADKFGNRLWTKYYGNVTNSYGFSFQVLNDGGLILMGNSTSNDTSIYLVRTKPNGISDTLWTKQIKYKNLYTNHLFGTWGNDIQSTTDGGFVIAGAYNVNGSKNALVITINSDGTYKSGFPISQNFNSSYVSEAKSIIDFNQTYFVVAGYTNDNRFGMAPVWTVTKPNTSNSGFWNPLNINGINFSDNRVAIKMLQDNSIIYAGSYTKGVYDTTYLLLIKLKVGVDGIDTIYIKKSISQTSNCKNFNLDLSATGNYAVIGTHYNKDGSSNMYFLETDTAGNLLAEKTYVTTVNERGNSICTSINGGYITTGTIEYTANISSMFTLIKLKEDGGF